MRSADLDIQFDAAAHFNSLCKALDDILSTSMRNIWSSIPSAPQQGEAHTEAEENIDAKNFVFDPHFWWNHSHGTNHGGCGVPTAPAFFGGAWYTKNDTNVKASVAAENISLSTDGSSGIASGDHLPMPGSYVVAPDNVAPPHNGPFEFPSWVSASAQSRAFARVRLMEQVNKMTTVQEEEEDASDESVAQEYRVPMMNIDSDDADGFELVEAPVEFPTISPWSIPRATSASSTPASPIASPAPTVDVPEPSPEASEDNKTALTPEDDQAWKKRMDIFLRKLENSEASEFLPGIPTNPSTPNTSNAPSQITSVLSSPMSTPATSVAAASSPINSSSPSSATTALPAKPVEASRIAATIGTELGLTHLSANAPVFHPLPRGPRNPNLPQRFPTGTNAIHFGGGGGGGAPRRNRFRRRNNHNNHYRFDGGQTTHFTLDHPAHYQHLMMLEDRLHAQAQIIAGLQAQQRERNNHHHHDSTEVGGGGEESSSSSLMMMMQGVSTGYEYSPGLWRNDHFHYMHDETYNRQMRQQEEEEEDPESPVETEERENSSEENLD